MKEHQGSSVSPPRYVVISLPYPRLFWAIWDNGRNDYHRKAFDGSTWRTTSQKAALKVRDRLSLNPRPIYKAE